MAQEQKQAQTVSAKNAQTETPKKAVVRQQPKYTVEEFASAPQTVGAKNADIVFAAFSKEKETCFTVDEAKEIVKKFSKKEVK